MDFDTAHGARQAEAIVTAAMRCLARDGYAATSLQDIAEEAGTSKRMVHYYYESRERLFAVVAKRVGDRLMSQVRDAVAGLDAADEIVNVGVDRWWHNVVNDSDTEIVYFGLLAESLTDPVLKDALASVNDGLREMLGARFRASAGRERGETGDAKTAILLTVAMIQGLKLDYLERGQTPELDEALGAFKRWLVAVLESGQSLPFEAMREQRGV